MATADLALPHSVVAVLLGGLAGLLAGAVSSSLAAGSKRPDRLSWLLALGGALALAVHPAGQSGSLPLAAGACLIGLLLLVAACDFRERAVYPAVIYPGIAFATAVAPLLETSVIDALLGGALSAALFGAFYGLARLRYGRSALGDGDIAVAALLGVAVGLSRLPLALTLAGVFGAVLALLVGWRARSLSASFAYAPALCLAALASMLLQTD